MATTSGRHRYSPAPPPPVPAPALPLLSLRRCSSSSLSSSSRQRDRPRPEREMVMMGQLGRLVDGIKSKLRAGGGGGKRGGAAGGGRKSSSDAAAAVGYDKVEKTDSMRVEIRSRQARKLIAKNLDAADSIIARGGRNKRFFLAF